MDLFKLLKATVEKNASDLHLTVNKPPTIRIYGDLVCLDGEKRLSPHDTEEAAMNVLTSRQKEILDREYSIDLGYDFSTNGHSRTRFRVNAFYQKGFISIAFRKLYDRIVGLKDLNLPLSLHRLADLRDGLVLITGPTGSGKTTTLASVIDHISRSRPCHIITIEDPIEYVHEHNKGIVNQREINVDVNSFADALRYALREDPDVILVGEMRDLDTIRTAIMAAETGHLVFSTLHSRDAVSTINRVVGIFPREEQQQIRQQFSLTLAAVVSQRLLKRSDKPGFIPSVEVMMVTPGISNLIRQGKDEQIYSSIETGAGLGMQTMEQSLLSLLQAGKIDKETVFKMTRTGAASQIKERVKQ
jgi:twitching motility protein PilT